MNEELLQDYPKTASGTPLRQCSPNWKPFQTRRP